MAANQDSVAEAIEIKSLVTPPADRRDEPQADACATHKVAVVLVVEAQVAEGITAEHLAEFVRAPLENRKPDLHEDIYDELTSLPMTVTANPVNPGMAALLFPALSRTEAMEEMLDAAESPAKARHDGPKCGFACAAWFGNSALCDTCDGQQKAATS